jgi:CxxC motif-containing protein (DUF1111 family)
LLRGRAGLALVLLLGLGGCERYEGAVTYLLPDLFLLPGGAFEQPVVVPKGFARAEFLAGHQAFAMACGACHPGDGRAASPVVDGALTETAILSLTPPDPTYGGRLDPRAASAQARVAVDYRLLPGRFPDGEAYELRLPRYKFTDFADGPLAEGTVVSLRAAPPVIGTALISALEQATPRAGRFGWKAAATGLIHDGLADSDMADDLSAYLSNLGAPPRGEVDDPRVRRGGAIFASTGCPACHRPRAVAGASATLPETEFFPYSDFLPHDMGKGLADAGAESGGDVAARQWRTAPLWGLSRGGSATFLHDGRARNLMEAILWHGGEATPARKKLRALPKEDRAALIAFLESL